MENNCNVEFCEHILNYSFVKSLRYTKQKTQIQKFLWFVWFYFLLKYNDFQYFILFWNKSIGKVSLFFHFLYYHFISSKKFSFEDFFPYCSKPEDKCLFLQIYYEETPKAQLTFGRCSNIKWNIIMFVCLTFVIFWYKKIHFI